MRDVSIIIPSFNRPDDLDTVLPYYFGQKDVKEIIIVDDGSTKSYSNIIEKYKDYNNEEVRFIYYKLNVNAGAGSSRNIGLSIATGKYILWGEDDAFPSNDYIEVLKKKISGRSLVFGSIYYGIHPNMQFKEKEKVVMRQQNENRRLFDYDLLEGYYRLKTENDVRVPWGHALFMVEKEAYNNVRYFEGYKVNGYREETDAQVQILKSGYTIKYTSDTCCYHFPAKNSSGGQHRANLFKFEIYKIRNNDIFLNRHYRFLQKYFDLKKSIFFMKMIFRLHEVVELIKRTKNKIKRCLLK